MSAPDGQSLDSSFPAFKEINYKPQKNPKLLLLMNLNIQ